MIQRAQEDAFAGCARAALLLSDNRWVLDRMAPHRLVGEGDRAMGRCPGHDLRTRQSSAAVSGLLQTAPPATAHDVGQRGALAARERETTMTTITLKALLEVLLGMQGTFVLLSCAMPMARRRSRARIWVVFQIWTLVLPPCMTWSV